MADDYADVIDADDYTQGLAEHPDIPQADAGIVRMLRTELASAASTFRILDLGCGPGRLTKYIADELTPDAARRGVMLSITGLDVSKGFLEYARAHRAHPAVEYTERDFMSYAPAQSFDAIVMQGLFHHIRPTERAAWVLQCLKVRTKTGLIIVGDEFVPPYAIDAERVLNVAGLYAYVIAYALRGGHTSLAKIESMNLVDDVCAGLPGAGHSDDALLAHIQSASKEIYELAYTHGVEDSKYKELVSALVAKVQHDAGALAQASGANHDRGDYKISIEKQKEYFTQHGLSAVYEQVYGPVPWLGGMAALGFR